MFRNPDTERSRDEKKNSIRTVGYWEGMENRDVDYNIRSLFVPLVGLPAREWDEYLEARVVRVEKALKRLPARQRKLLLGYYVEGKKLRELAVAGERRQSVHERVKWARTRFIREWEALG